MHEEVFWSTLCSLPIEVAASFYHKGDYIRGSLLDREETICTQTTFSSPDYPWTNMESACGVDESDSCQLV